MKKRIFFFCISLISLFTKAQNWEPVGGGLFLHDTAYNYPTVYALCVYKGKLYAGGNFNIADNKKVNYIACWDGQKWDSVGSGMNGIVKALCVYKGQLYAGGYFHMAGGKHASEIAKWDGTKWARVSFGLSMDADDRNDNGCVRALCVYHNELYACGDFGWAGGNRANCIAKWDSLHWSRVGKPLKNPIYHYIDSGAGIDYRSFSMATYKDKLYLGGYIMWAGDLKLNLARFNGKKWDSVPNVISRSDSIPPINPLGVYKGKLLVEIGGYYIRGQKLIGAIEWNDTNWSELGGKIKYHSGKIIIPGFTEAICVDSNNLYLGGDFFSIGGIEANNVAFWNGENWQSLGDGLSKQNILSIMASAVCSLAIYKGYIYAGGHFNSSGTKVLNHIARWKLPSKNK